MGLHADVRTVRFRFPLLPSSTAVNFSKHPRTQSGFHRETKGWTCDHIFAWWYVWKQTIKPAGFVTLTTNEKNPWNWEPKQNRETSLDSLNNNINYQNLQFLMPSCFLVYLSNKWQNYFRSCEMDPIIHMLTLLNLFCDSFCRFHSKKYNCGKTPNVFRLSNKNSQCWCPGYHIAILKDLVLWLVNELFLSSVPRKICEFRVLNLLDMKQRPL